MKQDHREYHHNQSEKQLLSWTELLEKGTLLQETIRRCSLAPGQRYRITKACTDGTFQKGDVIILEAGSDLFCPATGRRISPGQCRKENMDFMCEPFHEP